MIVVDAMIIVYFLMRHPGFTEDIDRVQAADLDWCSPLLWRSEFRNVLMKYVRATAGPNLPGSDTDFARALEYMQDAEALVQGRSYRIDSDDVLRLAHDSGCSPYDCEYVALAQNLDTRLVTTDEPVLEAFSDTAVHPANFAPDGEDEG
jgi:predicted nucleic acid-binding protein